LIFFQQEMTIELTRDQVHDIVETITEKGTLTFAVAPTVQPNERQLRVDPQAIAKNYYNLFSHKFGKLAGESTKDWGKVKLSKNGTDVDASEWEKLIKAHTAMVRDIINK
jgi:hypothetical protein